MCVVVCLCHAQLSIPLDVYLRVCRCSDLLAPTFTPTHNVVQSKVHNLCHNQCTTTTTTNSFLLIVFCLFAFLSVSLSLFSFLFCIRWNLSSWLKIKQFLHWSVYDTHIMYYIDSKYRDASHHLRCELADWTAKIENGYETNIWIAYHQIGRNDGNIRQNQREKKKNEQKRNYEKMPSIHCFNFIAIINFHCFRHVGSRHSAHNIRNKLNLCELPSIDYHFNIIVIRYITIHMDITWPVRRWFFFSSISSANYRDDFFFVWHSIVNLCRWIGVDEKSPLTQTAQVSLSLPYQSIAISIEMTQLNRTVNVNEAQKYKTKKAKKSDNWLKSIKMKLQN